MEHPRLNFINVELKQLILEIKGDAIASDKYYILLKLIHMLPEKYL